SSWIPTDDVRDFVASLLEIAPHNIRVNHAANLGFWSVESDVRRIETNTQKWGTPRYEALQAVLDALNLKTPTIMDVAPDDNKKKIVNQKETEAAREKQQKIKDEFKNWIWREEERTDRLARKYNEEFNNTRLRAFSGDHLTLPGANPQIVAKLKPHQRAGVWRIVQTGNTGLFHVVGAGKTYTMAGAGMELRRLGIARKPMYVVPNHMLEQFSREILELYPTANILVADKKDFEKKNRRLLMSRIATNDWDAVVVTHASFRRLPMSAETQSKYYKEQIEEITRLIEEEKRESGRDSKIVKQIEAVRKKLEDKYAKRLSDIQKDQDKAVTFEETGVDWLFVDEAHEFKNLQFPTKMSRVAGLNNSQSVKSDDMFLKTIHVNRLQKGRGGVVFATGTPVSNTMAEMFTMQRYLQLDTLKRQGLLHFDSWAASFGEAVTSMELAPDGSGYRLNTRFSKFVNLPELMGMFRQVSDIQTAEMLNLPVPTVKNGKPQTVSASSSGILKQYVETLVRRSERIRSGQVDPREDNMLKVTNDGRKAALDMRLIDPSLPDEPNSKVNRAADNIYRVWEETKDSSYAESKTSGAAQLVFCDLSTPKKKSKKPKKTKKRKKGKEAEDSTDSGENGDSKKEVNMDEVLADSGAFSVYDDIREKLIQRGIPKEEIAFIHDYERDQQKAELFNDVREGRVRILLGSTSKMGAGTNVQKRLVALHHLDAPWRPADIEQREGRIVRQGNENPEVQIYRYVTEGSFDAYMWQTLESKARFISQVMRGDNYLRNIDDVAGAALSYAEVKAIASGNPKVMEKAKVDAEARRLSTLKRAWQDEQRSLQSKSKRIPESIEWWGKYRDDVAEDIKARKDVSGDNFAMAIQGSDYIERKDANDALRAIISKYGGLNTQGKKDVIGNYAGFKLAIAGKGYGTELRDPEIYLRGKRDYYFTVPFNSENVNVTVRLENLVKNLESEHARAEREIGKLERDLKTVTGEYGKPFEHEAKLNETLARQAELDKELEIGRNDEPMIAEEESDEDKPPEMSFDSLDKSIYQDSRFREIRKMAERLNKAFPNLPAPVTVIDSINDLPPNLRNRIQQAANKSVNGKPMMVSVSGLFDPKANRIYLVADGLIRKSTAKGQPLNRAVLEVLFHEATHGATDRLIDMFGGDWKRIVDNVFGHWSNNPVVRKEIAEIKQLYKEADWRTEKGRNTIARELIARMGEKHIDHSFTRWIIAKLRQVLRRIAKALGVKMNISHTDMLEAIRALKQSWENQNAPPQPPVGNKETATSDSAALNLSLTGLDDTADKYASEPMTEKPTQEDFVKTTLAYSHAIYNSLFPIKKYQVSGYDPATGAERRDTHQSMESAEKAASALRKAGYAEVNIQPVGAVGFLQKTLLSPEYWNHPVFKRFIDTALRRQDTRHEHLNKFLTDNDGEEIYRKLDRLKKPQYKQLENVLVWADTKDWNPPKDVTDKSAWKEAKTIGEMERRGYSKEVIDAWRSVRRAYDRALDTWLEFQGKDPLSRKMLAQEITVADDAGKQHRLTLREALDEMGELRGSYAPRQRIGEYVVRAKDKSGNLYRYHRNRVEAEKLHAELKAKGWKVEPVQEAERMAESVYQELKIPMTQKAIEEAIRTAKLGENTKQVYESLIIEMANLIKARGFRSRAIARNVDMPVVHGYETDPKTALLQYASSLSSGLAKAEAAREMYSAINEIDSRKEAETYDLAVSYVANQLRNSDHIDGQLGFIKSLAAFKYLGFNVKSAAVNLLSLPTTAPAAIHEYAGGKIVGAGAIVRHLSKSVRDFGLWMAGKDVKLKENERKLLNELKQKAWANPQATTEALSHINSRTRTGQISNAWAKLIETAMAPFGFTERINRGSTILAAYRVAVQSGMSHDEAVKAAKLASDRAHGIYNKATLPIWAQGTMGRAFQPMLIFSKYGHNYMQLLYELGFRRKNYKAMIYASLAPIVLGGGMAIPMKSGIVLAAGAMLSAIGIDNDPEKWWWDTTRKYLGENGERAARYGAVGYFTPVQLSGSLQPNIGVGIPSNVWELLGAGGGVIKDFHEGFDALSKGDMLGAPKALLPTAFSAPFKAYSEYTHGLATKRHKAIFDERGRIVKPTLAEAVMKGVGFQPTRTSMILARRYEGRRESENYADRRNALYDEYRILASRGAPPSDMVKFLERVYRYNAMATPAEEHLITPQSLQRQAQTLYRAARKDWAEYQ
ncbi:MAG: PLxRFG domain-containing protein, partial [Nitrospinae bacterium]|nr:PLxRFG domain-containing protein [Nitrospinota bacterium]